MKTDIKSINALAGTLAAQQESKRDFIVNTKTAKMSVVPISFNSGPFAVSFKAGRKKGPAVDEEFEVNRYALNQIATHIKVPMALVDLMMGGTARERAALAQLMSVRLQENEALRMIRTMAQVNGKVVSSENHVRAFLSDKYRILDNYDLANEAILPVLSQLDDLKIESLAVTDEKMYIKALVPSMAYEIGKVRDADSKRQVGDIVQAGIVISNSEVGAGRLMIEPLIFRLICLNGAIANDAAMKRNHVGRTNGTGEFENGDSFELYSDKTLALDDAAFFSKVKDTIEATVADETRFEKIVHKWALAKGEPITGHAVAAVTELGRKKNLNESEQGGILQFLIEGGDLSKFGLANAVTAFARDDRKELSYNRATELERIGGDVIELGPSEWKVIADAVPEGEQKKRSRNSRNN